MNRYCLQSGDWSEDEKQKIATKLVSLVSPDTSNPWYLCKISDTHFFAYRATWEQSSLVGDSVAELLAKIETYYNRG